MVILQAVSLWHKENKLFFQLLVSGPASITPTQVFKLPFWGFSLSTVLSKLLGDLGRWMGG